MIKKVLGILFLTSAAFGANEYKQPNPAIFYNTVKLPQLSTSGIVTNASSGQLGSVNPVPVANGGTNSSKALVNSRVIVSSGGTIGEGAVTTTTLGFLDATSSIQTQLNGKQSTLTLPLSVANGGTNSGTALVNNRFIISSGGTIGEGFAIPLQINKGGTNTTNSLSNNRVIVSSGGTIGELSSNGSSGQVLTSTGASSLPTWQAGTATVGTSGTSEHVNRARILGDGSCTITSQSGSWLSSPVHNGTGDCTFTIAGGEYTAAPACVCTGTAGTQNRICSMSAPTQTSLPHVFMWSGGADDEALDIICMGPH